MPDKPRIAGVVVLYHPDLEQLSEGLASYASGLDLLYVFANAPIAEFPIEASRVEWIHSPDNVGIAGALNVAARRAIDQGFSWLLTMDQDSRFIGDGFSELRSALNLLNPKAALLGAMAGYLSLWTVWWLFKQLTGKEGMGHGDFKLLAAIGAWTGLKGILPTILLSSLVGAIIGSIWLAAKGRDRATPIPFGPYLAIAGWITFFWGDRLVDGYLKLAGLG